MENENENEKKPILPLGIRGIPIYGGKFVQYNVLGNLFEVPSKYSPPIQPVGSGAYGIVCCAKNSETKEDVAIKKIGNAFDNRIDAKRTLREIKLLTHMDHENVRRVSWVADLQSKKFSHLGSTMPNDLFRPNQCVELDWVNLTWGKGSL